MAGQKNTGSSSARKETTTTTTQRRTLTTEGATSSQKQSARIEEINDEEEDEDDEDDEDDSDASDSSDMEEIADPEKWRIIKESGILEKVKSSDRSKAERTHHHRHKNHGQDEGSRDYIFEAIFFSIPTTCLFVVMDILVHRQFGENYAGSDIFHKVIKIFPAILIMVYFTNKSKSHLLTQAGMFLTATACGCYFLHTMFRSPAMGIMMRAPGIITILVYCIVQLDLLPAVISLGLCGLYYKFGNVKYPIPKY